MDSLIESLVIALLVITSFYGLYMATFVICLRWLLLADEGWRLRSTFHWPMLTASILIFASFTIFLGANARLMIEYLTSVESVFYDTYVLGAVTIAGANMVILVTDVVMIYRCWKVYKKSWRITILPVLFWLACFICIVLIFYYNHQDIVTQDISWSTKSIQAHAAFYPFNAATNIYTTAAIIYRVMRDASEGSGHSFKHLKHLCRILAETGTLYTLTTIPPIVGFFLDGDEYLTLTLVAEAINVSMAGITFNLVLIRVGQSRADARSRQLDYQATNHRGLFSGRHHDHHPSSIQEQSITFENSMISKNALGSGVER